MEQYLPLSLHIVVAIGFAAAVFMVSFLAGRIGKRTESKDMAYECGVPVKDTTSPRFSVKFYLVAMLFVLFDIEVVFMYPWAVIYRDFIAKHEAMIFWSMGGFVAVLTIGYIYALKKGALDWKN